HARLQAGTPLDVFSVADGAPRPSVSFEGAHEANASTFAMKYVLPVSAPGQEPAVFVNLQAQGSSFRQEQFSILPPVDGLDTIGKEAVCVGARWLDRNKQIMEMSVTYSHQLDRGKPNDGIGASIRYPLPNFLSPLSMCLTHDMQVCVDRSNQERVAL